MKREQSFSKGDLFGQICIVKREQRAPRVSGLPGLFGPDPQDREDAEGPEGPGGGDVQDLLGRVGGGSRRPDP